MNHARIIGQKFGKLTLSSLSERRGDRGRIYGSFLCECGNTIEAPIGRVKNGGRTHCGCSANRTPNLSHGMRYSREYSSWVSMKGRCLDQNNKDFPRWGGRGISVCDEWANSFESFFAHVGARPAGTTLDRINNTKGYEPRNVRWATPKQQALNTSSAYHVEIEGHCFASVADAALHHGVSEMTIIRWCDGYVDKRRIHLGKISPRSGCFRRRKDAA